MLQRNVTLSYKVIIGCGPGNFIYELLKVFRYQDRQENITFGFTTTVVPAEHTSLCDTSYSFFSLRISLQLQCRSVFTHGLPMFSFVLQLPFGVVINWKLCLIWINDIKQTGDRHGWHEESCLWEKVGESSSPNWGNRGISVHCKKLRTGNHCSCFILLNYNIKYFLYGQYKDF